MNNTIKNGDTVTVHYTGKLDDGSVFDTSKAEGREPLTAPLGQEQLIPGFEAALIGMAIGESKTITLEPSDAYGDYSEEMVVSVPLEHMPGEIAEGTYLQINTPYGPQIVTVKSVNEEAGVAMIDHNHALAGKRLTFDLEIVSFETAEVTEEK
jgi:peptidylprolyl isomerase